MVSTGQLSPMHKAEVEAMSFCLMMPTISFRGFLKFKYFSNKASSV